MRFLHKAFGKGKGQMKILHRTPSKRAVNDNVLHAMQQFKQPFLGVASEHELD
jgi:hypothetical protein